MSGLQFYKGTTEINCPSYVCNPLSKTTPKPDNSDWMYYYYTASSSETIKIINSIGIPLDMCIFAQGGPIGVLGYTSGSLPPGYTAINAPGGSGGGGQVLNKTQFTAQEFEIELKPIGLFESCQLKTITPPLPTINIIQGYQGARGGVITVNTSDPSKSTGGMGAIGGRGGGAAGNAGFGGYILDDKGNIVYSGLVGSLGVGYNPDNTGKSGTETANATLVNFADGTSAEVARAGMAGQSGNVSSGFLLYYRK